MRTRRPERISRRWWSSRWFFITLAIVFLLLSISLAKEAYRSHQINEEIEALEEQIAALEQKNREYAVSVEYLKTDLYFQEQARLKLGYKAPGEKVVVLQGESGNSDASEEFIVPSSYTIAKGDGLTNSQKWINYFFLD